MKVAMKIVGHKHLMGLIEILKDKINLNESNKVSTKNSGTNKHLRVTHEKCNFLPFCSSNGRNR